MISVAMCTYNGEKYIEEQLRSLMEQTRKPDEIVITDDCSKDSTVEIINRLKKETDIDIRLYVNDPNLGVFKNFPYAISLCKGDIIFCCDQDDVWKSDKIEKMAGRLESDDSLGLVFANAEVVLNDQYHYLYPLWEPKQIANGSMWSFKKLVFEGGSIAGCCMCFRKSFVDQIYPFPDNIYHDDYLATCAAIITKIGYVNEELMHYRQHGNNVVGIIRGSKLSYIKSLFTNIRPYLEHKIYILDRHRKMYETLKDRGFVSEELKKEMLDNIGFCAERAAICSNKLMDSYSAFFVSFGKNYYIKYARGNKEFYKDLYDAMVARLFMRGEYEDTK